MCRDILFVARQDLHVHATPPVESVCCRHPGNLEQLCLDIAPPDQQHTLLHVLSEQPLCTCHLETLHDSVHVHIMPCCQHPAPYVPSQRVLRHQSMACEQSIDGCNSWLCR